MKNAFKIAALLVLVFSIYAFTTNEKAEIIKVVIDAGHGGDDFGAVHKKHVEKNIVSQISSKINALNKNSNVKIYFTRTEDKKLSLEERAKIINDIKPDLFLSLHINNHKNDVLSGVESYVAKESLYSDESLVLAEELTSSLSKATNLSLRPTQKAPFYILKNTYCPGIIVELGFLSNENDRKYLTDGKYQEVIAKTIVDFISQIK